MHTRPQGMLSILMLPRLSHSSHVLFSKFSFSNVCHCSFYSSELEIWCGLSLKILAAQKFQIQMGADQWLFSQITDSPILLCKNNNNNKKRILVWQTNMVSCLCSGTVGELLRPGLLSLVKNQCVRIGIWRILLDALSCFSRSNLDEDEFWGGLLECKITSTHASPGLQLLKQKCI